MNNQLKVYIEDLPKTRTPIFTHCRKLLKEGFPEDTKVWFYRKDKKGVQVKINNLGLAAKLTVLEDRRVGPRFVLYKEYDTSYAKKTQTPYVVEEFGVFTQQTEET